MSTMYLDSIQTTSIPTLGLLLIDETIHPLATSAIKYNNASKITQLGIDYAISSPVGSIGWTLAESRYWTILDDIDGSRLWQFNIAGNSQQSTIATVNLDSCTGTCEVRSDPWRDNRYQTLDEQYGDVRLSLKKGQTHNSVSICQEPYLLVLRHVFSMKPLVNWMILTSRLVIKLPLLIATTRDGISTVSR